MLATSQLATFLEEGLKELTRGVIARYRWYEITRPIE